MPILKPSRAKTIENNKKAKKMRAGIQKKAGESGAVGNRALTLHRKRADAKIRILTRTKEYQATMMRQKGLDYETIADLLGYKTVEDAHRAVMDTLARMSKVTKEAAEDIRSLEVARLDKMLSGLWTQACSGDPEAVQAVLKISDRRAKLLGLDSVTKIEITPAVRVYEGVDTSAV